MAIMEGALEGAIVVVQVAANLIAFIAILHFLNSSLEWFGLRVGQEGITFEVRYVRVVIRSIFPISHKRHIRARP